MGSSGFLPVKGTNVGTETFRSLHELLQARIFFSFSKSLFFLLLFLTDAYSKRQDFEKFVHNRYIQLMISHWHANVYVEIDLKIVYKILDNTRDIYSNKKKKKKRILLAYFAFPWFNT
jgi:hypothetical protein